MKQCSRWASAQFVIMAALGIVGAILVSLKPSATVLGAATVAILVGFIAWVFFNCYLVIRNIIWLVSTRHDQETRQADGTLKR